MNRIYSATRYDTPEITALREEINADGRALDEMVREHRRQERERFAQYDDLLRQRRPSYPTSDHLQALEQVARLVHDDLPYGDHLGCPRPQDREAGIELPASVHFSSQASRINVYAGAPYAAESTRRLWQLDAAECAALRDRLRELSLRIVTEWVHEDGIAFVVASRRV
ncbi:MAG: hypothetical protein Q4C81_04335 [Kocuria sp.]|nr:hypothetical protein [Kocuria sp.]